MNEIKNELLQILKLMNSENDKDIYLSIILDNYKDKIKTQLADLESKRIELLQAEETLKYVTEKLKYKLGEFYKENE